MKFKWLWPILLLALMAITACASSGGDQATVSTDDSELTAIINGFVHGFVILFALISLIIDSGTDTLLAEPIGNGQWYYAGYLVGVIVFFAIFPIGYRFRRRRI